MSTGTTAGSVSLEMVLEQEGDSETSQLSMAEGGFTRTVPDYEEEEDEDFDDSADDVNDDRVELEGEFDQLQRAASGVDLDGLDDESSELMIRVNTQTDLKVPNEFAVFSVPRSTNSKSSPSPSPTTTPVKSNTSTASSAEKVSSASKKKVGPSESLRVQHGDLWLNQFILPRAASETKLAMLQEVGRSSNMLTPPRTEDKKITTLRTNVENSHFALDAMEVELEEMLARLQQLIPPEEFLPVVARCLNLKKQAIAACIAATTRAMPQ